MIGLLQRVSSARVQVAGDTRGEIGRGLMVLVGVERDDTPAQADRLLDRLLGYRVFPDVDGKMNLNLLDVGGGLLLVPQFTLPAPVSRPPRHRPRVSGCSTISWRARGSVVPRPRPACSVPTCR